MVTSQLFVISVLGWYHAGAIRYLPIHRLSILSCHLGTGLLEETSKEGLAQKTYRVGRS